MVNGRDIQAATRSSVQNVKIGGRSRIHCSYHKCLTSYFQKVASRLFRSSLGPAGEYRHFNSRIDDFYRDCEKYAIASVNNHVLDLNRFEDVRVTRFVRDPRDLVVSGYFYHKRAAEPWCDIVAPTQEDWAVVNGTIPDLPLGSRSYARYLNEVSLEEGLLAELAFRRDHFESMSRWDDEDSRIEVFRYEEILGHEPEVFDRIFRFFELPFSSRQIGLHYVRRFRAGNRARRPGHIRDPRSGQWRDHFTPAVTARFNQEYGDLLDRLGYPAD
jgi:hypothetical protein